MHTCTHAQRRTNTHALTHTHTHTHTHTPHVTRRLTKPGSGRLEWLERGHLRRLHARDRCHPRLYCLVLSECAGTNPGVWSYAVCSTECAYAATASGTSTATCTTSPRRSPRWSACSRVGSIAFRGTPGAHPHDRELFFNSTVAARRRSASLYGGTAAVYGGTAAVYGCVAAVYGCTAAVYGDIDAGVQNRPQVAGDPALAPLHENAMPGTDEDYGSATYLQYEFRDARARRLPSCARYPTSLRSSYAMSGTGVAYGGVLLRSYYAMSSTGVAYGSLLLRACLCDMRYAPTAAL
eukprot:1925852-Rhodomonas_salina.2